MSIDIFPTKFIARAPLSSSRTLRSRHSMRTYERELVTSIASNEASPSPKMKIKQSVKESMSSPKVVENKSGRTGVPPPMSPHMDKLASPTTDKGLTFLQNARKQDMPVRAGKWNTEEELYLRKLVSLFNAGTLDDIEEKSSMRAWLAKMLNCCPMRISKKQMHGEKFCGKAKFTRNATRIAQMTQQEYDGLCSEVHDLRARFLRHWAKEEFGRKPSPTSRDDFNQWFKKVMELVPEPRVARHPKLREAAKRCEADLRRFLEIVVLDTDRRSSIHCGVKRTFQQISQPQTPPSSTQSETSTESPKRLCAEATGCQVQVSPINIDSYFVEREQREQMDNLSFIQAMTQYQEVDDTAVKMSMILSDSLPVEMPHNPGSDEIVLDFGPPSLWMCLDERDAHSPDYVEWEDDGLLDDWNQLFAATVAWEAPDHSSQLHLLPTFGLNF